MYAGATGIVTGAPGSAGNVVNQLPINNTSVDLPLTAVYITMSSEVQGGSQSAAANAFTTKRSTDPDGYQARLMFTLQYTPDPGKTLEEDPPGSTVTLVVTLSRNQAVEGNTSNISAAISAYSRIQAHGVSFPEVSGSASGAMQTLGPLTVVETIKVIEQVSVPSPQFNYFVYLNTQTGATYTVGGGGGTTGGSTGGTTGSTTGSTTAGEGTSRGGGLDGPTSGVSAIATIQPSLSFLDIVLIVPDPKVFPETFPIYPLPHANGANRYVFSTAATGVLQNPDWQSEVVGGDPNDFLPNTVYTSFNI